MSNYKLFRQRNIPAIGGTHLISIRKITESGDVWDSPFKVIYPDMLKYFIGLMEKDMDEQILKSN